MSKNTSEPDWAEIKYLLTHEPPQDMPTEKRIEYLKLDYYKRRLGLYRCLSASTLFSSLSSALYLYSSYKIDADMLVYISVLVGLTSISGVIVYETSKLISRINKKMKKLNNYRT